MNLRGCVLRGQDLGAGAMFAGWPCGWIHFSSLFCFLLCVAFASTFWISTLLVLTV
jgi:hypothetical protein